MEKFVKPALAVNFGPKTFFEKVHISKAFAAKEYFILNYSSDYDLKGIAYALFVELA